MPCSSRYTQQICAAQRVLADFPGISPGIPAGWYDAIKCLNLLLYSWFRVASTEGRVAGKIQLEVPSAVNVRGKLVGRCEQTEATAASGGV